MYACHRLVRVVAVAAALSFVLAACGGGSSSTQSSSPLVDGDCVARNDTRVTIYSGRTENLIAPILDGFSCATGIGVRVKYASSTELALLLAEEGDATAADVFLSRSPGPVGFLEGFDLLAPLSEALLDLVDPVNRSGAGTWVGFSARRRVLVYNTDSVTPDELPDSVFDLTDAKYRGRVAIPAVNGSFEDWFTVMRSRFGDDVATEWLDDMVANDATSYANNRAIVSAVGRGVIDFGLVNHYYNYQERAILGDEHRAENYDFPDGDIGSLLIVTAAAVTKASDDPETAELLVEYLLSEAAQRYFTEETFEYPLAAGVQPAAALPALDAGDIGEVDFDTIGDGFTETERIIRESGILNQ